MALVKHQSEVERLAHDVRMWLLAVTFVLGVSLILSPFNIGRGTTDTPGGERSGLSLHTDHETGCQYLSRPFSSPIPRMTGAGKQAGCRP